MSARMDGAEKSVGEDRGQEEQEEQEQGGSRMWRTEALLELIPVPQLMIHVGLVLFTGYLASILKLNLLFVFTLGFAYLCHIEVRQRLKIEHRIRSEERNSIDRKRLLSDTETARWLNSVIKSVWPIFAEKFASEHLLMRMAPWFLTKYKPWTAKKVVLQRLYLGKSPPVINFLRVGHHTTDGDHLVLEMTINFSAARDMTAVMAVQMRKRLAGLWTSLHISGVQLEGNVKVGVRFVRGWPVISRLRICFSDAPVLRMVAKPIFSYGMDVTDLPGIASWLDKMIIQALEESLVEPNLLVVDVEKLVGDLMSVNSKLQTSKSLAREHSKGSTDWFHVGHKGAVATLLVDIIEADQLKPCDPNGKADPYVKIILGKTEILTTIKRKTLNPSWHENFRIPITNWGSPNVLTLHVRDKDRFIDDWMGHKHVSVEDLRDGERHDMWLHLDGVKTGRLRVALTVVETQAVCDKDKKSSVSPDSEDATKGPIELSPEVFLGEGHELLPRSESNGESVGSEDSEETPLKDESEHVDIGVGEAGCVSIVNPGRHIVKEAYSTERARQRNRSIRVAEKVKKPGKSLSPERDLDSVQLNPGSPGEGHLNRRSRVKSFLRRPLSRKEDRKGNSGEDLSGELSQEAHELHIVGKMGSQLHMTLELNDEELENLEDRGLQDELPIVPESGDLQGCNVDDTEKPEKQSWKRAGMKKLGRGVLKQAGKTAHDIGHALPLSLPNLSDPDSPPNVTAG